jgi:NIMA-interacting peptidyl-prolyl cis-trans isomerase 1
MSAGPYPGAGGAGALPPNWVVQQSRSQPGCFYYYNSATGASQWERPMAGASGGAGGGGGAPTSVRASHILIKHKESRKPYSWRDEKRLITKTKEDAARQLSALAVKLQQEGPASFGRYAELHSDCSSAKHRGDLGPFERGKMQRAFEDVAFQLKVGEMSNVVSTDSGVHLILRTA